MQEAVREIGEWTRSWGAGAFSARSGLRGGLALLALGMADEGLLGFQAARADAVRPNILLIIGDDYGIDGNSLYNGETPGASIPPTPQINSLYSNGVMFRSCYAYPTSSPTRSTILTGRYGFRTGIGYALESADEPCLTEYERTIPEVLEASGAGYDCAMFGKWHDSLNNPDPNTLGGFPLFVGSIHGAVANYFNWPMVSNGVETTCTEYATISTAESAIRWIKSRPAGTNWFCWVAFNASHTPYHKPPAALCPSYAHLLDTTVDIATNPRPYYEAITEGLDWGVGNLLTNVDLETTTVIFLGDNGTLGSVSRPFSLPDQRIIQPPYDVARGKGTMYQGGIRVPLFVAGAGVSNAMRVCTNMVSTVDLFSTILELAGVDTAEYFPPERPLDSLSFAAALTHTAAPPHRSWVLSENFPAHDELDRAGRCILDARCKYLEFQDGNKGFYDLSTDPMELTNLYGQAMSGVLSNHLVTLSAQLANLQNYPVITEVLSGVSTQEVRVAFINDVDFTLWSTPCLTGGWVEVAGVTTQTNTEEVALQVAAGTVSNAFYRVSAPER